MACLFTFVDNKYYRVREIQVYADSLEVKADRWYYGYPKNFSYNWDVDEEISDALTYHDRTFFFTGRHYLRYNDNTYKVQP